MDDQKAARVDWKVSIIPADAGNRHDPLVADPKEIEAVLSNPGSLKSPAPIEPSDLTNKPAEIEAAPRYNANVPYTPQPTIYSPNDQTLIKAVQQAVKNGWRDAHRYANDAMTIGLEGEAVVSGMKKRQANVNDLLLDKAFNQALWGDSWQTHLKELVVAEQPIDYIKEQLDV